MHQRGVYGMVPFLKHHRRGVGQAHVVWNCYKTRYISIRLYTIEIPGLTVSLLIFAIATILRTRFGANALAPRAYDSMLEDHMEQGVWAPEWSSANYLGLCIKFKGVVEPPRSTLHSRGNIPMLMWLLPVTQSFAWLSHLGIEGPIEKWALHKQITPTRRPVSRSA